MESGEIEGYVGATTMTTLDYLLTKSLSPKEAKKIIKKLLKLFEVAPINRLILEDAVDSALLDFEEAVLHSAAIHSGIQAIVTRDEKGFGQSTARYLLSRGVVKDFITATFGTRQNFS